MNAFICKSKSRTISPADAQLRLMTGADVISRDVRSRHPAGGLVMNECPLVQDKRATRSKVNSTMAVAMTAREFASLPGPPLDRAATDRIDAPRRGKRQ